MPFPFKISKLCHMRIRKCSEMRYICLCMISVAYAQIQPQALIKQQPQQFVIQHQAPPTPRLQTQLLQTASIQPHPQTASLGLQSSSAGGPVPVLPKPPALSQGSSPSQQATIFHSTVSQHSGLSQSRAQPVQLTAINLQIQPAHSQVCHYTTLTDRAHRPLLTNVFIQNGTLTTNPHINALKSHLQ